MRITDDLSIGGVLVRDTSLTSSQRVRRMRSERAASVTLAMLHSAASTVSTMTTTAERDIVRAKQHEVAEYLRTNRFRSDFLAELKPIVQTSLSFVHDYRQINAQILQNINVIIESRYAGDGIEDKLKKASQPELAIYKASKMLDEKLNVARFLMDPTWLDKQHGLAKCRFQGLVEKYLRLYGPKFQAKNVDIQTRYYSYLEVVANSDALSVIPHTLIDNAAKYAPQDSRVEVRVQDTEQGVDLSVSSYGPVLLEKEKGKLFTPFYRGENARKAEEDGAGYGLYVSQLIARRHLGTEIHFQQEPQRAMGALVWTTFAVRIPKLATAAQTHA